MKKQNIYLIGVAFLGAAYYPLEQRLSPEVFIVGSISYLLILSFASYKLGTDKEQNGEEVIDPAIRLNKINGIKAIVESALRKNSDINDILKKWPFQNGPFLEGEEDLIHILSHYATDSDIRAKDKEYENSQKQEVLRIYNDFQVANKKQELSRNELPELSDLQREFSRKIESWLKYRGVTGVGKSYYLGDERAAIKFTFGGLRVFVYDDGGAEILSVRRIDRIFRLIPVRIDWRFKTGQYTTDKLQKEFFEHLAQALVLDA